MTVSANDLLLLDSSLYPSTPTKVYLSSSFPENASSGIAIREKRWAIVAIKIRNRPGRRLSRFYSIPHSSYITIWNKKQFYDIPGDAENLENHAALMLDSMPSEMKENGSVNGTFVDVLGNFISSNLSFGFVSAQEPISLDVDMYVKFKKDPGSGWFKYKTFSVQDNEVFKVDISPFSNVSFCTSGLESDMVNADSGLPNANGFSNILLTPAQNGLVANLTMDEYDSFRPYVLFSQCVRDSVY